MYLQEISIYLRKKFASPTRNFEYNYRPYLCTIIEIEPGPTNRQIITVMHYSPQYLLNLITIHGIHKKYTFFLKVGIRDFNVHKKCTTPVINKTMQLFNANNMHNF